VSIIFQQTATTVIVGWLAGGTDKNHITSYTKAHKLLCVFIVDTQFTNVAVGRVSQPGALRVSIATLTVRFSWRS